MFRLGDELLPTSARLEMALAPACWRCGRVLWPGDLNLVPGEKAHPYVWVCAGCVSDDDREALST